MKKIMSCLILIVILTLLCINVAIATNGEITYINRYLDENTQKIVTENKTLSEYKIITNDMIDLNVENTILSTGWYFINSDITMRVLVITGDVKIVIADDVTWNVNGITIGESYKLTIYGQTKETGKLISDQTGPGYASGIGGFADSMGTFVLNGGNIETYGTWNGGVGIGGYGTRGSGQFTMYGGNCLVNGRNQPGITARETKIYGGNLTIAGEPAIEIIPTIANSRIDISSDGVENNYTNVKYSDITNETFTSKYVKIYPCTEHNYTKLKVNDKTILKECEYCGKMGGYVSLGDVETDYEGTPKKISVVNNNFDSNYTITYTNDSGYNSTTAPTTAGIYTATIALDEDSTIITSATLKIKQISGILTNKDYKTNYIIKNNSDVDTPLLSNFNSNSDVGSFSYEWYEKGKDELLAKAPSSVGTYILRAAVAETANVAAATIDIEVTIEKEQYTITINPLTGATIDPNKTIKVDYDGSQNYTIKANDGYKIISILVNGKEKLDSLKNDVLTLSNVTENTEITVETQAIVYEFTEGQNATYTKDDETKKDMQFKLNGLYSLFDKVYVNGKELSKDNYTVKEGSTIITLKNEYLSTLDAGTYTLKVAYTTGASDETTFVVKEKKTTDDEEKDNTITDTNTEKDTTPKTGDYIVFFVGALLLAILGTAVVITKKNKINKTSKH